MPHWGDTVKTCEARVSHRRHYQASLRRWDFRESFPDEGTPWVKTWI
jgi:hypothetical protein